MKIAVATSPHFFVEENAILQALFEEGLDMLHLHKPNSEPIYCERLLTLTSPKWYNRIIVNDHFYLQSEYELKGIHISTRNPQIPKGYKGFVTRSCPIEETDKWVSTSDYIVVEAHPSAISRAVEQRKINHKVYIRDINTLDGVHFAKECGFGGIILEDVLWSQFDFHESDNFKDLINLFKIFRKAAD